MNKSRRMRIENAISNIDDILSILEKIRDEEQNAYDSLPEAFQSADKGIIMDEAIGYIDEAISYLEDASNSLYWAKE